ncbi:hypothetical protein [Spiroplasma culicicola]|uniref:ECF transporter S component n=1 Tax=Spiroplasma culicicola AES-1 TaxID=1276246 RepID=W6A603_9MOLU|nr:hypothetical protein [Spiroplasma culicicola]AHI52371.1 hypothetical protein SCULI_v1c00300 [Spiroplasma culicicola AES-1]
MQTIAEYLLNGNNLAYIASGAMGILIVAYIIYNSLSFLILKERYHGIRFTTKNIAYITMFTAVSVSVTVVISLTVPITVFPPIRIAFEGVMVKITGFIFGPIVGVIVGLITEILVMIFVPSFIHPAFIIVIICYGFVAGIGSSFLRVGKGNNWVIIALINIFLIGFALVMVFLIDSLPELNAKGEPYDIGGFSPTVFKWIFLASIFLCIFVVWALTIFMAAKGHKKTLNILLPIILFATASEYLVTSIISAWGDYGFLGLEQDADLNGYFIMLLSRLIQAPLKILFNSTVLYYTYKAVSPLIKRDR